MGKFQIGNKGGGRKKGSKAKNIQEVATKFILGNMKDMQHEWDYDMSPGQKIKFLEVLLPFASPKLQAMSVSQFERLDDDTLMQLVEGLKQGVIADEELIKIEANETK